MKEIKVNSKVYKVFKQKDFSNVYFWNSDLSVKGCAPLALSIIISGYQDIDPIDIVEYMEYGSFDRIIATALKYGFIKSDLLYFNSLSFNESEYNSVYKKVKNHLNKGFPIIALIKSKSLLFSKLPYRNHFIAILGIDEFNNLIIGNPGINEERINLDELMIYYMNGGRKGFLLLNPPSEK